MSNFKQEALKVISDLPEETTAEELVYRIYMLDNIRKGLEDIKNGRFKAQEEVELFLN